MRKFFAAVGAAALLSLGGLATATVASANPLPSVSASTSVTHHPDTTAPSPNDGFCTTSPGGPVWALDTYTSSMTAVNTSGNDWTVSITDNGSFAGFALPTDCSSAVSHGSFTGTYTVDVVSPTGPVAADLKSNYDGAVSTSTMVEDFFNGAATSIVGGAYDFSYQGGNYVQTTDSITGAVVPDACTVTITAIPDQSGVLGDNVTGLQVKATTNEATPPSHLLYGASGLPNSLHIDNTTGLISGTLTGPTGTSLVTIKVYNTAFSNPDAGKFCVGTTTFKWNVTLTAPTPTPTPTPTGTSGGGGNVPTGAPATGGGTLPAGNPTGQTAGIVLLLCAGLILAVSYTLRKVHQDS